MTGTMILAGLLPLIVFVLLDAFAGPKIGIISAMILGVLLTAYFYFVLDDFDETILLEALLIVVLGGIALKFKKPQFFRFQPVVVGVCLALFLAWFQFFDEPYLVKIMPRMVKITPQFKTLLESPHFMTLFATISGHLIVVFLVHAAVVAYSAVKWSTLGWLLMRLAIYPLVAGLVYVDAMLAGPP